ncbi:glucose-1-phosphate thymidylyltransferase [Alicyclobacillus sp. SO9]|uniref:glucose-1-phosphate thymidylyltransferase n=1 Tax=Alicyclobacillus sp. SO9 TaxID=2665646 RepID=UPI0018E83AB7|nr:glucose-1-phosphate thymidylyltransferase [Alicyclobacillus sp. SO9]QQE79201.1 glucose-1-phosphate thymidylyltransferase [Alicyclobacillus sp. SO9]
MKALILSGGTGSRLRPLTYTGAKQLIPVANKPILFYAIEAIRDAGIKEIGIIVNPETGPDVERALGDGAEWGLTFVYIMQDAPRGLAHAVKISQDFIGNESFLMYLGDNLVRDGVTEFVGKFRSSKANSLILLSRVPDPQRFGVAELDGDRILRLVEKPKVPQSDLALVGVYLFDSSIFHAVNQIKPSWRNELEITDAIQYLIEHDYQVDSHIIDGWWKDTGKPEDVLEANRMMLEYVEGSIHGTVDESSSISGRVVVEESAQISRSVIRGPVIIASGAKIQNAYIGPFTSVSREVTIENSEVENSIILEGTQIVDISTRIDSSLIGKNVRLNRGKQKPKALNFVLGDNSSVEIL